MIAGIRNKWLRRAAIIGVAVVLIPMVEIWQFIGRAIDYLDSEYGDDIRGAWRGES